MKSLTSFRDTATTRKSNGPPALGHQNVLLRRSNSMMPVIPWVRQAPCYARITKPFASGDVCFQDQTILRGARFGDVQADVLILETTRGKGPLQRMTRQTELDRLKKDLQEVLKNNGSVLIPTFALGLPKLAMLALMTREGSCASNPFSRWHGTRVYRNLRSSGPPHPSQPFQHAAT